VKPIRPLLPVIKRRGLALKEVIQSFPAIVSGERDNAQSAFTAWHESSRVHLRFRYGNEETDSVEQCLTMTGIGSPDPWATP
jgi:hypothetical protein